MNNRTNLHYKPMNPIRTFENGLPGDVFLFKLYPTSTNNASIWCGLFVSWSNNQAKYLCK